MNTGLYKLFETVCTTMKIGFLEHFVNDPEHFFIDEAFQGAHLFYMRRVLLAANAMKDVVDVISWKYISEDVVVTDC